MAIGMVYQSTTQNIARSTRIKAQYEMTEFANSLLAEDAITRQVAQSGTYGDIWDWTLARSPAPDFPQTPFDSRVFLERIAVTVSQEGQSDVTMVTEVVRRK
jgi:hypothetical protein